MAIWDLGDTAALAKAGLSPEQVGAIDALSDMMGGFLLLQGFGGTGKSEVKLLDSAAGA